MKFSEEKATCDNCVMTPGRTRTKVKYSPELKCCTFEPIIPNYLLGWIFSDDCSIPEVDLLRQIFRLRTKTRDWCLPLGIVPRPQFQVSYNIRGKNDFGNRAEFLCRYFDAKNDSCSIWQVRGSVCSSFFCKSSYGKTGIDFWKAFENYYFLTEMALIEECLVMLDFSPRQISEQLAFVNMKQFEGKYQRQAFLPEAQFKELWNSYKDVEDFYLRCYEIVKKLNRKEYLNLIGQTGKELEKCLKLT